MFTFFISDDPDDITTDLALDIVTTDVLNCSPLNSGAIEVTHISVNGASNTWANTVASNPDLRLRLYSGATLSTTTPDASTNSFSNLTAGSYEIAAYDEIKECEYEPTTVIIKKITTNPDLNTFTKTDNTGCEGELTDGRTGGVDVTLANANNATEYTIEWYVGDATSTTLFVDGTDGTLVTDAAGTRISGTEGGLYTLKVLDTNPDNDECASEKTFTITDDLDEVTNMTLSSTADFDCATSDNGTITITGVEINNDGLPETNAATLNTTYEFLIYSDITLSTRQVQKLI